MKASRHEADEKLIRPDLTAYPDSGDRTATYIWPRLGVSDTVNGMRGNPFGLL